MPGLKKINTNREVEALESLKTNNYVINCYKGVQKINMLILITRDDIHDNRELARLLKVSPNSIQLWKTKFDKGNMQALLANNRGIKSKEKKVINKVIDSKIENRLNGLYHFKSSITYKELYNWLKKELPDLNYSTFLKHIKANHLRLFNQVKRKKTIKKKVEKKRTLRAKEMSPIELRQTQVLKELRSSKFL